MPEFIKSNAIRAHEDLIEETCETTLWALPILPMFDISQLAALLKSAGDNLRLEILRALATDSFGVLELTYLFDIKQSGMSHHLKVLAKSDLVSTRKEGNTVFYRRQALDSSREDFEFRSALYSVVDKIDLSSSVIERRESLFAKRAESSQQFFNENADKFRAQQDLIAEFAVYGKQVESFLSHLQLPGASENKHDDPSQTRLASKCLEVGCGDGQFLPFLAQKFSDIWAIDINQAMLEKAKQYCLKKCGEQDFQKIHFVKSDTTFCTELEAQLDCVVINMVLHHAPSPTQIFKDIAPALKRGASVVICDLCSHNQDWARSACGDVWLGFEPNDLSRWAQENFLSEGQSEYFALRNGFQIQIRQFTQVN